MTPSRAIAIFGATGDLAQRMLFPALYFLSREGLLPDDLIIIGCSRGAMDDAAFAARVGAAIQARTGEYWSEPHWARLRRQLRHAAVDASDAASFANLRNAIRGTQDILFYLSTSPSHYGDICRNLKAAGLASPQSRVVVEKPIGRDLASCRAINDSLAEVFSEERIFRIDHYLGKEAVQNLLALRFANTLFEPCGTRSASNRCRSRSQKPSAWRSAGPITTNTARCATWCRTMCYSFFVLSRWNRRRASMQTPCATRR